MGMSSHVIGFRPPDEKWERMKSIYDSCVKANVTVPKEVYEFFGDEDPDESGVEVNIKGAVNCFSADAQDGYEVDIRKLPKDVNIIRFYNSY